MASAARKTDSRRCSCHTSALGHHFSPDLVCAFRGCRQTWEGQQQELTVCSGWLAEWRWTGWNHVEGLHGYNERREVAF